jgi:hypothetical protein
MSRSIALLLLVTLVAPLAAETVIVPIRGDLVFGADGSYFTEVAVTNMSSVPVTVRRGDVYPVASDHPCGEPLPVVIPPLETTDVPTACIGLYAYTLESDGPIRVDAVVTTTRPVQLAGGGNSSSFNYQKVETALEWLPADRQALIPLLKTGEHGHINLFVINPNDHALIFRLRVTRRSPLAPARDEEHVVSPRTTAVIPIERIEDASCQLPIVCGDVYGLRFSADSSYYAAASSVEYLGDALFASPSLLDDSTHR